MILLSLLLYFCSGICFNFPCFHKQTKKSRHTHTQHKHIFHYLNKNNLKPLCLTYHCKSLCEDFFHRAFTLHCAARNISAQYIQLNFLFKYYYHQLASVANNKVKFCIYIRFLRAVITKCCEMSVLKSRYMVTVLRVNSEIVVQ